MNLERIRRDKIRSSAEADSRQLPKPASIREPSLTEAEQPYREWNPLLCVHCISYFQPCGSCKRTRLQGHQALSRFLAKLGIPAQ